LIPNDCIIPLVIIGKIFVKALRKQQFRERPPYYNKLKKETIKAGKTLNYPFGPPDFGVPYTLSF
jgi:hypothetical protein